MLQLLGYAAITIVGVGASYWFAPSTPPVEVGQQDDSLLKFSLLLGIAVSALTIWQFAKK